ncbi:MAG: methyltransferase [Verrucomicrobiaceae bacterium]|nr:methyltransferase [Verrucomicrobiaceae bacterium]
MKLSPTALKKIASRGQTLGEYFYLRTKLGSDPVYEEAAKRLASPALPILDIGCGMGLLTHYLREGGNKAPMTSFDFDARKIESAKAMSQKAGYDDVSFAVGDARHELPDHQGHVVILDILQFMKSDDQATLLRLAASRVAPGGNCIIRSCLRDDSHRFKITVLGDWFARITLWMKESPVWYPTAADFKEVLSSAGLTVTIVPLWGGTPFNNHLIVAQRPME